MKTLITFLALGTAALVGLKSLEESSATHTRKSVQTLEQQLASYVSPELLQQINDQHVIVRFRLDDNNQIARLDVKGATPTIKLKLANQLTGKALKGSDGDTESTYEARFRVKSA